MDLTAFSKADQGRMLRSRGGAKMMVRTLVILALLTALSACDFSLGLDVMNAADHEIVISLGSNSQTVSPGLSFHGDFPAADTHSELRVINGRCQYRYALPNLDTEPWHSLIGKSFKLRWFSGGRMVAYPPTPDVKIRNNRQRASTEEVRTILPTAVACH